MHNKIMKLLSGAEKTLHVTDGEGGYDFHTKCSPSIENIKIFGKTDQNLSGLGVFSPIFMCYEATFRMTGENLFSKSELIKIFRANYGSAVNTNTGAAIFTPPANVNKYFITSSDLSFKANTPYTLRFNFVGAADGQSTGLAFEYTDGSTDEIFTTTAAGALCGAVSAADKTVNGIRAVYTGGNVCRVQLDSFGLYEGVRNIGEYIPFSGGTGTYYMVEPLCSDMTEEGFELADYLDWKNNMTVHYFKNFEVETSDISSYDVDDWLTVARLKLPEPIDPECPMARLTGHTYVKDLDYIRDNYCSQVFTLSEDGQYLYVLYDRYSGYQSFRDAVSRSSYRCQYKMQKPKLHATFGTKATAPVGNAVKITVPNGKFRIYRADEAI